MVPAQTNQTVGLYAVSNTTGAGSSTTADARSLSFQGAGVASVGYSNGSVVISVPTGGGAGDGYNIIGVNGGATELSTTYQLSNANNVSFGLNAGTITASASFNQTVQPVAYAAGGTTNNFSTIGFVNTNGVSWSTGTGGIQATVKTDYLTTARASNDAIGLNTALTANGVSMTANSSGLSLNFPAFLTTAANSTHSHGNGSLALTNLTGTTASASNGWTISLSAANPGGGGGVAISADGTAAAGSNSQSTGTVQFANSNGVTFGLSNNGVMTASVQAGAAAGVGALAAGGSTLTSGTVAFGNANGISFGFNGSTVTASCNGDYTLQRYPPFPQPLASSSMNSGTTGATGGSFQTTAHIYLAPFILHNPIQFQEIELYASHGSVGTANSTWQQTIAHMLGLYSLNADTALSLISTFQVQMVLTASSNTAITGLVYWGTNSTEPTATTGFTGNSTGAITGLKNLKLYDANASFPAGQYWWGHAFTMRTSNTNMWASPNTGMYLTLSQTTGGSYLGITTGGIKPPYRHLGSVSTTSNGTTTGYNIMPASINTTAITNTGGSSQWRWIVPNIYN